MRNSKKHGSILLTTVIIFMFITMLTTSFLSLVINNYTSRVFENERVESLYGAESGINTAYNVLQNTISAACLYSSEELEKIKSKLDNLEKYDLDGFNNIDDDNQKNIYALYGDIDYLNSYDYDGKEKKRIKGNKKIDTNKELIDILYNNIFEEKFIEFINHNLESVIEGEHGKYIDFNYGRLDKVEGFRYEKLHYGGATISLKYKPLEDIDKHRKKDFKKIHLENGYNKDGKIKYVLQRLRYEKPKNELSINIKLNSKFQSNMLQKYESSLGESKRNIDVIYNIRVPNYNEITFKSHYGIDEDDALPSFVISKSLEFSNTGDVNVNGDVYVSSIDKKKSIDDDRIYEKYSYGFSADNRDLSMKNINFNDNFYIMGSFNIKNNSNININGNLYAQNIYAGDSEYKSNNSKLTILKDTILENDLTVNATNTEIELNNFYGIGDKSSNDKEKPFKSSSIIVNSLNSNSKVKINNEAYILGVAHINTEGNYETGESVAVKGNYEAYSKKMSEDEKIKYDFPLQLLDSNNIFDKAKHFYKYWTENSDKVNTGGVVFEKIDKVKSIGAIVGNNGEIVEPKMTIEDLKPDSFISSKKYEYEEKRININSIFSDKFENQIEDIVLKNDDLKNVKVYSGNCVVNEPINYEGNIVIYGDIVFNKDVNITGNIISNGSIKFNDKTNITGVVLQRGDLYFNKKVFIRGTLIIDGNLIIDNRDDSILNYDSVIVSKMQSKYSHLFNKILSEDKRIDEIDREEIYDLNINHGNFINSKVWRIVQ